MKSLPITWKRLVNSKGESPCRTVWVGRITYETIPEQLFIRAALTASSHLLETEGH